MNPTDIVKWLYSESTKRQKEELVDWMADVLSADSGLYVIDGDGELRRTALRDTDLVEPFE